jgi:DNA-binding YbaB/EbfC family protein
MTDELRNQRVVGSAGGGMVEIEVNGLVEVLRCRVDPSMVSQNDRELLEDLIVVAVNQAISKAKELHAEKVRGLTSGIPLPGLEQALAKFFGGVPGAQGDGPGGDMDIPHKT